jgi:hypothetical protein
VKLYGVKIIGNILPVCNLGDGYLRPNHVKSLSVLVPALSCKKHVHYTDSKLEEVWINERYVLEVLRIIKTGRFFSG